MWRQKEMQSIWWCALRKIRLWTTNLLVFKCTINQACFGRKSAKLFDAELTTSLLIRLLERKGKLVQNGGLVQPSPSSDQVVQRAEGGAMCQLVSLVHSPSWVGFCKSLPDGLLQGNLCCIVWARHFGAIKFWERWLRDCHLSSLSETNN